MASVLHQPVKQRRRFDISLKNSAAETLLEMLEVGGRRLPEGGVSIQQTGHIQGLQHANGARCGLRRGTEGALYQGGSEFSPLETLFC